MAAASDERGNSEPSKSWVVWGSLSGILLAHLLFAALLFDPKPFVGGDNAQYVILAESLASGQGYRDLFLPGTPNHTDYPPFYPAILGAVSAFKGHLLAFKVVSILFSTAAVLFFYLLSRRRLKTAAALGVTAALALNPVLLYYSHWVLPETLFLALVLAALWLVDELDAETWRLATGLALATLAFLSEAPGGFLLLALGLATAWRRRWLHFILVSSVASVVVGGWWLWRAFSGRAAEYLKVVVSIDPDLPSIGQLGPGGLLARAVDNARLYAVELLPQALAGPASPGIVTLLATLLALTLISLALVSWVRDIRRFRPLAGFSALYSLYVCLLPQAWSDRRYLLPLLPVLILYAALGLVWCFEFLRARRPVWAVPAVAGLLILITVPGQARAVTFNQRCQAFYRQEDRLACYPPPWRAFAQTALWARDNVGSDAVFVSPEPRLFYLFSQSRGYAYPATAEDAEMLEFLDGVRADYVVIAAVSATTYRYIVPVVRSQPEHFAIVHTVGSGPTAAYVLSYRRAVDSEDSREE